MLRVDVEKRLGEFSLSATFETEGGVTALYGTSGSGKTSLVNMIAGLVTPDRGHIIVDGMTMFDSKARINLPPYKRGIGYVFQEGRLFPHMNVRANLDYGRRMTGQTRDESVFTRVIDLLGIGALLDRRPGALSGGERQRVAIGRALLMQPRLLLLDEPLASLDSARKAEIFPYLQLLRDEAKVPMIYVSHSLAEIRRIANTIVFLNDGRVISVGDAQNFQKPESDFD